MAERTDKAMMAPGVGTATPLGPLFTSITGSIESVRATYPDSLSLDIRDRYGNTWQLSILDSRWSPLDTNSLEGKQVQGAVLAERTGQLDLELSDGTVFRISPNPIESADDPPNWDLITPNGWAVEYGPGPTVRVQRADAPVSS